MSPYMPPTLDLVRQWCKTNDWTYVFADDGARYASGCRKCTDTLWGVLALPPSDRQVLVAEFPMILTEWRALRYDMRPGQERFPPEDIMAVPVIPMHPSKEVWPFFPPLPGQNL